MNKEPITMKRLHELYLMTGLRQLTLQSEIAIADSRNLSGNDTEEHWGFGNNMMQIQAVNCSKCGNYKITNNIVGLTCKICCECSSANNYNSELIKEMMIYEQMDAFIRIEAEGNLLCEDVVGEILTYLHQ
jgi:hypothetical protein